MSGIARWVRLYIPTDPSIAAEINDLKNQKRRAAFRFTLHQMGTVEAEMAKLVTDLSAFNEKVFSAPFAARSICLASVLTTVSGSFWSRPSPSHTHSTSAAALNLGVSDRRPVTLG